MWRSFYWEDNKGALELEMWIRGRKAELRKDLNRIGIVSYGLTIPLFDSTVYQIHDFQVSCEKKVQLNFWKVLLRPFYSQKSLTLKYCFADPDKYILNLGHRTY